MRKLSLFTACAVFSLFINNPQTFADDWPQWRGPDRDGLWKEDGIIEKFQSEQLPIKWRVQISSGYSGPTVAEGRVYITDRVAKPEQIERVHCFDAETGSNIWAHTYKCSYNKVGYTAGPRASVTIDRGKAYSLGTMGNLFCFDAAKGTILWEKDLNELYKIKMPVWGIASSPLVENDLLIVQVGGKDDACIVAFDKVTGAEQWKALDDNASYSAPIMINQGPHRVLVCWTGDRLAGLNPDNGQLYWQHEYKPTHMVINIATPVLTKDFYLFVSCFYDGSMLLKLDPDKPAAERVWRRIGRSETDTDSLHSCISTPVVIGEYIYGVDSYGELRCLELKTGDRVWEDLTATPRARWSNIHFVQNADKFWMFNERGELVIGKLSPKGFTEISRTKLIEPTTEQLPQRGGVCWSHPAYANKHIYARNDQELLCADLSAEK